MLQIIAMGGGGFSMEPDNPRLDQYVLAQTNVRRPKVCFLAQASGDSEYYITGFHQAFKQLDCIPSHLSLFKPHTADIASFLAEQNVIYVGGGNTKSMLAVWREWGVDKLLRTVAENGTVLTGLSAGAICWFEYGLTDSIPGPLTPLLGLGFLKGSCSPHYDGEANRRPTFQHLIATGELPAGYAFDDGAAGHFVDGVLQRIVSSRPNAKGYFVERLADAAQETALSTEYLSL